MKIFYVHCFTDNERVGRHFQEDEERQAYQLLERYEKANPDHNATVLEREWYPSRKAMKANSIDQNNIEIKRRVVCEDCGYKSNWTHDENDLQVKIIEHLKKHDNHELKIIEKQTLTYKESKNKK